MSNENKARLAHELLDEVNARQDLTPRQVRVLRSFLPERPKINTLEDVYREVCNAWYRTDGDVWKADAFGELEDWLRELHEQLKGLIDSKPALPALPEGMRLADHERYGRVVVSPGVDDDGTCKIFYLSTHAGDGSDSCWVPIDSLTFIDYEPAKFAHPEFLETEADYQSAPEGTIAACEDSPPWHKFDSAWLSTITYGRSNDKSMTGVIRRVLRWGWGE